MSDASGSFEKKSIIFENGQSAEKFYIKQPTQVPEILNILGIQESGASILVCGTTTSFKPRLRNRLIDLLSRGVAQVAVEKDAIIFDDGTRTGVSELIGQSVADRGHKTKLIGVRFQKKTSNEDKPATQDVDVFDPNHNYFVVTEDERQGWQAELMFQLADAIKYSQKDANQEIDSEANVNNRKRILTLLVGGDLQGSALNASLETVRRGWPLMVIDKSGPLADKIVKYKKYKQNLAKRSRRIWKWFNNVPWLSRLTRLQKTNPRLFEIISDGNITIIEEESSADQLRTLIKGLLTDPHEQDILWAAWKRFAEYDLNSSRHRDQWRWLKNIPLVLGVVSTLIVLIYSATGTNISVEGAQSTIWVNSYSAFMNVVSNIKSNSWWDFFFRFIIILLPITTSLILAIETRLKLGSKYILLRGAAEAVKRGIYSFRALKKPKSDTTVSSDDRIIDTENELAEHLAKISKFLLESDVKEAAFKPYEGPIPPQMYGAGANDDGFSKLDPDTYVNIRIGDQLAFYTLRTNQYEKRIRNLQTWILIWGAAGTFLAAIGAQYWLPITAALVSAMTAFLEYQQLEQILTKYNLTKSGLENVRSKWLAKPDRKSPENLQNLVREVEAILESENDGWVQYVSQAQKREKTDVSPEEGNHQDNGIEFVSTEEQKP